MINSVYCKTMDNLIKRISVRLVNNEKDYLKHVNKPSFISEKIFDKNVAVKLNQFLHLTNQFILDLLF